MASILVCIAEEVANFANTKLIAEAEANDTDVKPT